MTNKFPQLQQARCREVAVALYPSQHPDFTFRHLRKRKDENDFHRQGQGRVNRFPKSATTSWDLPLSFITAVLKRAHPRAIARCSCVASSWRDATQNPVVQRKLELWGSWSRASAPTRILDTKEYPGVAAKRENLVAVGEGWDESVGIWDLKLKRLVVKTKETIEDASAMCFAGDALIVGDRDGNMYGFGLVDGRRLFTVENAHEDAVRIVIEHGDGVVTGGADSKVKIWDRGNDCQASLTGHQNVVQCLCRAHEGKLLVSGGGDTTLRVWDSSTGECVHVLSGHVKVITCVDAHGDELVSGSSDYTVRFWDLNSGSCLRVFDNEKISAHSIAFNGFVVAAACFADHSGGSSVSIDDAVNERGAMIWDSETGKCVRTIQVKANFVWCTDEELVVLDGHGEFWVYDFSEDVA